MKIEGLEQMRQALRLLPENVQKNVLSRAVGKGAVIFLDAMKGRVLVLKHPDIRRIAGALRDALLRTRGKRDGSSATAFVAIKQSRKDESSPWYWRILEFGKSTRTSHPFVRKTFDEYKEAAATAVKDELGKGVEEEARKLAWKL